MSFTYIVLGTVLNILYTLSHCMVTSDLKSGTGIANTKVCVVRQLLILSMPFLHLSNNEAVPVLEGEHGRTTPIRLSKSKECKLTF